MIQERPFRMLVTGTRNQLTPQQRTTIRGKLTTAASTARAHGQPVIVVHGQCHLGGVDAEADAWADRTPGCHAEAHPAWPGKRLARNTDMVRAGADICLAFPVRSSRGTWDCVRKAAAAGIPCRIYPI